MALSGVNRLIPPMRYVCLSCAKDAQFVGLLTCAFRVVSAPASSLLRRLPNDSLLAIKEADFALTAQRADPPCSGFAPDSLVQQNKNACPRFFRRVAHCATK